MAKKQFDEWWLLEAQNIVGVGRATEKDVAETAWEAALECVRDTIIHESDGPSNPKDLMEWLNKELGDE